MKKFRRSPITIACYVVAALIVVYFCFTAVSTVRTIDEYYAQYGMTGTFTEYMTYIFQNGYGTLVNAILVFMAGLIYDAVRKLDPNNWKTDEELAEEKAAKRLPKEAGAAAVAEAKDIVEFDKAEDSAEEPGEAADENAEVVEVAAAGEVEEVVEFAEASEETTEAAEETVEAAAGEVEEVVEVAEAAEDAAEEAFTEELEEAAKIAAGTSAADML